ncbi:MAG: 30S ribosomal protein S18 [Patescibacteria group bacterium]
MMGSKRKPLKVRPVAKNCTFCHTDTNPVYKEVAILEKYLTERGKLLSRAKTGICASHQRKLGVAVKRARFVAMLPYVVRA